MKNKGHVFVYGSLKVGGHFAKAFDGVRKNITKASVKGTLFNMGSFPGIVLGGEKTVHGELHLYEDFAQVVRRMDYIEGYRKRNDPRNLYHKNVIEVKTGDGKTIKALVYTLNTDRTGVEGRALIEDGIWPID
jgi:gamma-glutamylcyclotransferase (GGCT)/AIG2-like uncharacterized protein YtfP